MKTITKIEEVQNYVTHTMSTEIATLKPSFRRIERKVITPLITKEIFDDLLEKYEAAVFDVKVLEDPYKELLILVQDVVCNLGLLNMVASRQLHISDSGIRIASNDEMKTAFPWQINDLKKELSRDGYDGIEDILIHLENNSTEFPEWKTSDAYFKQKDMLINTALEFDEYFSINKSRRCFLEIRYIIKRVEIMDVKPLLGNALFLLLKEKTLQSNLTPKQKKLLNEFINPGIALLTIAKGLVERRIKLDENGASLLFDGVTNNFKESTPAENEDISSATDQLYADGLKFLAEAKKFIDGNLLDFDDYVIQLSPETRYNIENTPSSGFYGV